MTLMPKKDYEVKWIPVRELAVVWPETQRGRRDSKVAAIKRDFDPDAFGVIAVTMPNGKGIYHVIDGQHRVQAVRELWGDNERVPCMMLSGKTKAEAAHIWSIMNGVRTMPQAVDRFVIGVEAGYEDEVAVAKILSDRGYTVAMGGDDGQFSAISSALAVYRQHGGPLLDHAFRIIQDAWGMARDSVNGSIVVAVADMLAEYPTLDPHRLATKAAKQYTPARLLGAAKTSREMFKGRMSENIVRLLVQTYNHNLRTGGRLGDES